MDTRKTKVCKKCSKRKPLLEFTLHHKGKPHRRSWCKSCEHIRHLAWTRANPEKCKKYSRAWSKAHPDKVNAWQRAYYAKHPKTKLKQRYQKLEDDLIRLVLP